MPTRRSNGCSESSGRIESSAPSYTSWVRRGFAVESDRIRRRAIRFRRPESRFILSERFQPHLPPNRSTLADGSPPTMPTLNQFQLPRPSNWVDFEKFCRDLWRSIWKDPNTQLNGRSGQPQHGVDVFGQPDQGSKSAGVQCKGKSDFSKMQVTETDLRTEVTNAKSFNPPLSQFIVATLAPRDEDIQRIARQITAEHQQQELFTVHVCSWHDIIDELPHHPDVVAVHYSEFAAVQAMKTAKAEILLRVDHLDDSFEEVKTLLATGTEASSVVVSGASIGSFLPDLISPFHEQSLDYARDLIRQHKPGQAIHLLEAQRDKIWSQATPHVKGRLLSLLGAAHFALSEERKAAELFVSAYQHAPDDERIACNTALGYSLLEEPSKAAELAQAVLNKNQTNSQARAILIHTSSASLSDTIAALPDFARSDSQVAFSIASRSQREQDLKQAEEWYRIALENDREQQPDVRAALGQIILERVWENKVVSTAVGSPTESDRKRLVEAEELLTAAWGKLSDDASVRRSRIAWLVNRGVARRLLGKIDIAIEDFEEALTTNYSQPVAIYQYALSCATLGQHDKALALISPLKQSPDVPSAALLMGDILLRLERFDEAVAHFKEVINTAPSTDIVRSAKLMLIESLIKQTNLVQAKQCCDALLHDELDNLDTLTVASYLASRNGDKDAAADYLDRACQCVNATTPASDLATLAGEAYRQKNFQIAAEIYERLTDPQTESAFTRNFVLAHLKLGNYERVLQVCQSLKQAHGPTKFACEIEATVQETRGDLPGARDLCEDLLRLTPDNAEIRIHLACLNFRIGDVAAVDTFLLGAPAWKDLHLPYSLRLAGLFAIRGKYRDAIAILYELRRLHADGNVHVQYLQSFLFQGGQNTDWLLHDTADVGAAVCVEDGVGQRQWFILEDRTDPRIDDGEITSAHPLFGELHGKQVGDRILLRRGTVAPEYGKIVELQSKYVRALQDSAQNLQTLFPDVKGFELIHLSPDGNPDTGGIELLLSQVAKRSEHVRNMLRFYQSQPLPGDWTR